MNLAPRGQDSTIGGPQRGELHGVKEVLRQNPPCRAAQGKETNEL